ncbi:MAG TPA: hypothetical protein PKC28_16035, partial [Bdellovibrionales bacterium]|nr:hypothetical protein [Bdellovibrionales bacterium]
AFLHETPGNSARIVRFVLPLKTSSWSAFTVDATLTISDMETPISFATCGADTFAVGRTSSNEFKAVRFPAPSEALSFDRILDVGASDVSGATSASCVVTHPHKAESPRVFVLNNPAAANSIYAFDGADSDCGSGTSYAALGGSSNLGQGTDLRAVLGVQNGPGGAQGFLAVHTDGTHPSVATFVPVTCATTLLTTNSPTTVGSFGLPDGDIRGAKFVDSPSYSMGMMSAKPGFAIFGANGNFNWLESR